MFEKKHMFVTLSAVAGIVIGSLLFWGHSNDKSAVAQPVERSAAGEKTAEADWCAEHRVPESECTLCHPDLIEKFKTEGNWCGEHNVPETHCRQCHPTLTFSQEPKEPITAEPVKMSVFFPPNLKGCGTEQAIVRFASMHTAERIGLKVEPVISADEMVSIDAPAEMVFDETALMAVTLSVPATVIRWLVEPGQRVAPGDGLAELQSPAAADFKTDFLRAAADLAVEEEQYKRSIELKSRQLISDAERELADSRLKAAVSRLRGTESKLISLGLAMSDLDLLKETQRADARWTIRSPRGGTILERRAPLGEQLPEGTTLGMVGDPSALWIQADVRQQDLLAFRQGQTVEFSADGGSLDRAEGTIIWVSQYLDPLTRTGVVRARVTSSSKDLRAHLFGRMAPSTKSGASRLLIPKDAVQWEGCCHIVFVQEATDRYRPKKVEISRGDDRHYLATAQLKEGDLVVTSGSFLLKTELKKESLGAGCVD